IVVSSVLATCMLFLCSAVGCSKAETEKSTAISEVSSVADEVQSSVGTSLLNVSYDDPQVPIERMKCAVMFEDGFKELCIEGEDAQQLYKILMSAKDNGETSRTTPEVSKQSYPENIGLVFYMGTWRSLEEDFNTRYSPMYFGVFYIDSNDFLIYTAAPYISFSECIQLPEGTYNAVVEITNKYYTFSANMPMGNLSAEQFKQFEKDKSTQADLEAVAGKLSTENYFDYVGGEYYTSDGYKIRVIYNHNENPAENTIYEIVAFKDGYKTILVG
ncbi:MAG: hypothetical protein ACI4M3_03780, partial [Acutalibacteraceae bacterium]